VEDSSFVDFPVADLKRIENARGEKALRNVTDFGDIVESWLNPRKSIAGEKKPFFINRNNVCMHAVALRSTASKLA
jgi:hypothetical protein